MEGPGYGQPYTRAQPTWCTKNRCLCALIVILLFALVYVVALLSLEDEGTELGSNATDTYQEQRYEITESTNLGPITFHKCNGCSWVQANLLCHHQGSGTEVASIHSQSEHDYAVSLMDPSTRFVHIGFNDIASNGNWVWTDGSPVDYTNWKSGQPQNNDEHSAVIYNDRKWADVKHTLTGGWFDGYLCRTQQSTTKTTVYDTSKGCVNGYNIGSTMRDKTVKQCATLCNRDDNCVAFESGASECTLKSSSRKVPCSMNRQVELFVKQ